MELVGLTGGVGMGKSTVADYLSVRGELVIDTDVLAREIVEPGKPALEEIRREFGPEVIQVGGQLDRSALARIVFGDESRRRALEQLLHPLIRAAWREQAGNWARKGARRAVVVIPLLFETGAQSELTRTICVGCSGATQRRRLTMRGWSAEEIERRIGAQWPILQKMNSADGVVWNESHREICLEQTARLMN
ncbi:MAG TPA: dephospho-CoA kinase [Verrucomicrobiae bacterium]|jgi:dephospho-CoA kinase|nr:dephospho-CoA kinase [Verrucomicrobiae bacterium]